MEFIKGLRSAAALLWCTGFFFSVFDALGMDLFGWHVALCYAFFGAAGVLCFWAEKREYSLRVALYRLHDLAFYSSWRFLLLYFLWINLFAPFTEAPVRSVLYALAGWFNLVVIGFSAQFLFTELRPGRAALLLRDRLQLLFWTFVSSSVVGVIFWLLHKWQDSIAIPMRDEANFFLGLVLGLPFLLWDLLLRNRILLSRYCSAAAILLIVASLAVADRKVFWLGLCLSFGLLLALRIYKRMSIWLSIYLFIGLSVVGATLAWVGMQAEWLAPERSSLLLRFDISLKAAMQMALQYRLLGTGIGVSGNQNGIWAQILAEIGIVGFILYLCFLGALLLDLYRVGREPRIVVSNVALVSVLIFVFTVSHFFSNAYTPTLWVWYALWCVLASSQFKKGRLV